MLVCSQLRVILRYRLEDLQHAGEVDLEGTVPRFFLHHAHRKCFRALRFASLHFGAAECCMEFIPDGEYEREYIDKVVGIPFEMRRCTSCNAEASSHDPESSENFVISAAAVHAGPQGESEFYVHFQRQRSILEQECGVKMDLSVLTESASVFLRLPGRISD